MSVNDYLRLSSTFRTQVNISSVVEIGLTDHVPRFFDQRGQIANWPSDLADDRSAPDEAAIFSVLQFGAIVPPLSPWKGVSRFVPGRRYRGTTEIGPVAIDYPQHALDLDQEGQ